MKVSFVETMRGALSSPGGERWPVEFDVVAEAPRLLPFLRDGRTELRGLLRLPPLARQASARGTLTLSPRALEYDLSFEADDGRRLRLLGHKGPSLLHPVRSMTVLAAKLVDAKGLELAAGEMTFDLKELLPFVLSWLPVGRLAQRALDTRRRGVERALLNGG